MEKIHHKDAFLSTAVLVVVVVVVTIMMMGTYVYVFDDKCKGDGATFDILFVI